MTTDCRAHPEPKDLTDEAILKTAAKELGYEFSDQWFLTGRNSSPLSTEPLELLNFARAVIAADRARAALATQLEPEELTDEEIMELMPQDVRDDLAAAASCVVANWAKAAGACRVVLNAGAVKHCRAAIAADRARHDRPAVAPVAQPEPEAKRDAVIAAVAEALGNAYDCLRVWEAWRVGTMGEDDFVLVTEDLDRVAEIADAAIEAMRPAVAPAPVAVEALQRLRRWGGFTGSTGYSADVVLGVVDWIDGGMTGPLPPLPEHIANRSDRDV
jgi:hypothetical protein